MKVKCNPSSPELKVSVATIFKKRHRNWIISFSILFLALSILLFSTKPLLNLVLGFVCVGFAIVMPLVHILSAIHEVRDTEGQRFSLSFGEKGLIFETVQKYFVSYGNCEAFEDEAVYTILANRAQIYCVPKRCFEDSDKQAEFEALLVEKLQKRYFKSK